MDVDEGIVEQAKFMGIHIIWKAELECASTRLLQRAFVIKVHHYCDGATVPSDKPLREFKDMLTEFQGVFVEPTFANSQNERQADFEI